MRLCEDVPDLTRSLVLEDPPSGGNDPNANAREVEEGASRAREDPRTLAREILSENPSWAERDTINSVASLRNCDAGALAREQRRTGILIAQQEQHRDRDGAGQSYEIPAELIAAEASAPASQSRRLATLLIVSRSAQEGFSDSIS